jgi:hypothetical protein
MVRPSSIRYCRLIVSVKESGQQKPADEWISSRQDKLQALSIGFSVVARSLSSDVVGWRFRKFVYFLCDKFTHFHGRAKNI